MSLTLNFTEYKKNSEGIISENQTAGIYEILHEKLSKINEFYTQETDLFDKMLKDPHSIWRGEVYNIPWMSNYTFLILALDFEMNVGYRNTDNGLISLAFDATEILNIVQAMRINLADVPENFQELEDLLSHASQEDNVISVSWG